MTSSSIKTVTSADLERKSLDSDIKDDASSPPTATMTNKRRSANSDVDHATTTTTYPRIAESAPFPALGSVHEVSRIMTRESEVQGQPKDDNASVITEKGGGDANEKPWEVPIETEGWRNPGWLAVIATFLVNFTVFGNSFSWGNFQRLYLEEVYAESTTQFGISFIGTLANSLLISLGVLLTPIISRFGYRATMAVGAIVCPLGMVLASFTTSLWQLYITQGLLVGIGGAFVFSPSITLPPQWFKKNRALASGIAVSGSGIGGVALSPLTVRLIDELGYRMALRVLGCLYFGILVISIIFARSRFRPAPSNTGSKGLDAFIDPSMLTWKFFLLALFCFLVPFGYIAPFFLAPTYASNVIHANASTGSTLVSIMSGMNSVCRICLGFMADHTGRLNTMFACTFLAGLFTMIVWQFSDSYGVFVAFCVLYGLTGGGFVSLFPVVTAEIVGVQNIQKGLSLCYFITIFGNLLGTPLIGLLQSARGWTAAIQFAGAPSVAAALVMLYLRFIINKKIFAVV
ncbi:hypothetical protein LRAMOSA05850 [Lichtheimia ramosa]|uniref:Major facilitator superfamily (MFS) profile domain-containing protein n=1 Tax=Lichtheimia ramosa TaxID=688394 RepID=A0A077X1E9_9FUNG|nr:hypothetical protein LRAMOSA05850 [Lichtheimia ramosa]